MKLEELIKNADKVMDLKQLNIIIDKPRQGKIYVYHDGVVATDKTRKKDLGGLSFMIQRFAEKNELMPFQKRIRNDKYIYFFVRWVWEKRMFNLFTKVDKINDDAIRYN